MLFEERMILVQQLESLFGIFRLYKKPYSKLISVYIGCLLIINVIVFILYLFVCRDFYLPLHIVNAGLLCFYSNFIITIVLVKSEEYQELFRIIIKFQKDMPKNMHKNNALLNLISVHIVFTCFVISVLSLKVILSNELKFVQIFIKIVLYTCTLRFFFNYITQFTLIIMISKHLDFLTVSIKSYAEKVLNLNNFMFIHNANGYDSAQLLSLTKWTKKLGYIIKCILLFNSVFSGQVSTFFLCSVPKKEKKSLHIQGEFL